MIDATRIGEAELRDFVVGQPWFGARRQSVLHARVLDAPLLRATSPLLADAFAEVALQPGPHALYQLPLGFRPAEEAWDDSVIAALDGWTAYDALADPMLATELVDLVGSGATVEVDDATVEFRPGPRLDGRAAGRGEVRRIGVPQSNSSVVVDEKLVLKVYRRLEAGINPELELLRFLTERDFPNVPALAGWYARSGRLIDATLGVLQHHVIAESDGWTFALESLAHEPDRFLREVARLGRVTGSMHAVLASDPSDPSFAAEEPSAEALGLLAATMDEEIEAVFAGLPEDDALAPIAGRGEEVRERLRLLSRMGGLGRVIRHHGDYHLKEVLWTGEDWIVIDFEGRPARSLAERRRKRSPLRDVASMLRSVAYVASASWLTQRVEPPPGWEERAREEFLSGYFSEVEASGLVPGGQAGAEKLLAIFELEKAVDELRYELDHRPDWVPIPVAAIQRLLEAPVASYLPRRKGPEETNA